jgi:membrane fusion protein (multidrug efflux system)
VDNYPGETFTGQVFLISPQVNTGSRNFGVGALVTNTTQRLKANTFARGALVLEKNRPALAVPLDAVVNFAGVTKVFVIADNKADERQVRTGRVMGPFQEILEGLKAGETVAVSGTTKLHEGSEVTVQTANPPAIDRAKP